MILTILLTPLRYQLDNKFLEKRTWGRLTAVNDIIAKAKKVAPSKSTDKIPPWRDPYV